MKIAGLDIGTTGCKCTVFDDKGNKLDRAYHNYPVSHKLGSHEIDAGAILEGVYEVISKMSRLYPDIAGIGVTSFGETFVCTDENGTPLLPSMLYTDPRGNEECKMITERLGAEHIAEITGLNPHEMYGLPKILWIKNVRPDVFEKTRHILQMEDFVIFSLTGETVIDYSLATRTLAFDINTLKYSDEILDAFDIEKSLFSEPVPTGTVAGTLTDVAAEKTGLSKTTKVIAISQDQVAAAIGAGALDVDVAVDGAGTVQCYTPIYDSIPDIKKMMEGNYAVVPYVVPGKFVTYAFSYTGGALIQWCTQTLAKREYEEASKRGISVNEYLEKRFIEEKQADGIDPDDPTGMLLLPHFAGAATPYMDTGSKGVIVGLNVATTVAEIYRACMEGVCYEMYLNYSRLSKAITLPKKLHATGGGAKSSVWMQMKADVLGIPIVTLKTSDAGEVGSAMLTGIALGIFTNLEDAANHMVETTGEYIPRPEYHEKYMKIFNKYERLYESVRELM